jgi:hypothetical protein
MRVESMPVITTEPDVRSPVTAGIVVENSGMVIPPVMISSLIGYLKSLI